ncbi:hypothetical protein [Turicimonas muris]|uniref:hypothetical protein n=1 Tax=Turicimonas muris TaxID=1796652 RepID=UPI0032B12A73
MESLKYLGWFESEKDVPYEEGLCFLPATHYVTGRDYFLYQCIIDKGALRFSKMGKKYDHGTIYNKWDGELFYAVACYGKVDKCSRIHGKDFETREDAIDHILTNFYTFHYREEATLYLPTDDTGDEPRDQIIHVSSYKGSHYFSFLKAVNNRYFKDGFYGVIKPNGKLYLKRDGGEVKISGLKNAPTDPKELTEFLRTFFLMEEC